MPINRSSHDLEDTDFADHNHDHVTATTTYVKRDPKMALAVLIFSEGFELDVAKDWHWRCHRIKKHVNIDA